MLFLPDKLKQKWLLENNFSAFVDRTPKVTASVGPEKLSELHNCEIGSVGSLTHTVPFEIKCSLTFANCTTRSGCGGGEELVVAIKLNTVLWIQVDSSYTISLGIHHIRLSTEWRTESLGGTEDSRGRLAGELASPSPRTKHQEEYACHLPLSSYYCGLETHYHASLRYSEVLFLKIGDEKVNRWVKRAFMPELHTSSPIARHILRVRTHLLLTSFYCIIFTTFYLP